MSKKSAASGAATHDDQTGKRGNTGRGMTVGLGETQTVRNVGKDGRYPVTIGISRGGLGCWPISNHLRVLSDQYDEDVCSLRP